MPEHAHQVTLVKWFDLTYPEYKGRLFAVPNGGFRHKATARKLSLEGVRKGVPDLFLPIPTPNHHGLFVELKSESGRPTVEQKEWISYLNSEGYLAKICKGWVTASKVISEYLECSSNG